jgi:hypothetical protein
LYRFSTPALILIDRVDSNARPGAIFFRCAGKFREIDLRVSKLSERHHHVKASKMSQWRLVVGA